MNIYKNKIIDWVQQAKINSKTWLDIFQTELCH